MATLAELVRRLLSAHHSGRTPMVAVDGRSASGKTTPARQLAATIPGARVVHTDDVAW